MFGEIKIEIDIMKIISVNSELSSLKFQLYQMPKKQLLRVVKSKIGFKDSVCT